MSLETSSYQLLSSLKTLRVRWEQACQHWNDSVRHDFEKDFWNNLDPTVMLTLMALDKLAQVIGKLKQECQGNSE